MNNPYTGGCACGAIRYECNAEPMFSWICHCRECQRATGGGGMVKDLTIDQRECERRMRAWQYRRHGE